MKIGIVSAEPSGDLLGSKILSKIKENFQNIEVIGVGGGPLQEHNLSTDREMLEIMGLVDPILNFQKIVNYRNDLIETFINEKIDIFIGIDAPDFNFEIHKKLQKKGIKTVHVVCPSVWAWRPGRVKKFTKVKLKGWKDKTDKDPIKNGIKNNVIKRLSRYFDII